MIDTYINILLHVFILFTFLTVYFFYKIAKVTENTLNNELGDLVDENMQKALNELSNDDKDSLKKTLKDINLKGLMDYYNRPDHVMIVNNNWDLSTSVIIIISLFLILLVSVIILKYVCKKNVNIIHIIGENIAVFALVGVIEVLFFLNVGMKYIPILPSKNVNTLLNTLKDNI